MTRFPSQISVALPPDQDGYVGRECPAAACKGYFKITPGTGVQGENTCYCAYCGHRGTQDECFTHEQIEYAKSIAINQATRALLKDLKRRGFTHRRRGGFGLGLSLKVEGRPHPIRYYRERALETHVECVGCGLRYAVYGAFAFCPDCSRHNSLQILEKNLELVRKELDLSKTVEKELAEHLVGDALENIVSAFDAWGREACGVNAAKASDPAAAARVRFQDLERARTRVQALFQVDLAAPLSPAEWAAAIRGFQKRHVLAHRAGVVDEEYCRRADDPIAIVGRKLRIDTDEVVALAGIVMRLAAGLASALRTGPPEAGDPA
jgi:hypothetical protein